MTLYEFISEPVIWAIFALNVMGNFLICVAMSDIKSLKGRKPGDSKQGTPDEDNFVSWPLCRYGHTHSEHCPYCARIRP
jgi:hypothetical protein